ncbi:MAG: sulfotransferase [Planctomycetia bacterium]|nr:sulfotransferase [Planctomycetia bacterium]
MTHRSLLARVTAWPPLLRIAVWAAAIVAAAFVAMVAVYLLGIPPADFLHRARNTLLLLALGGVLLLMLADPRPASDYGVAVGPHWRRQVLLGFSIGAGFFAGYHLLAWWTGAIVVTAGDVSPYAWFSALFSGLIAFPLAGAELVMFGGYFLGSLRQRHSRIVSVAVPAAAFSILGLLDSTTQWNLQAVPLAVGTFLVAALLGLVRLRTGSLPLPVGILAGAIFVRRLFRRTALFGAQATSPLADWLAPQGDPRQAPVFWIALAAAAVVVWVVLRKYGDAAPDSSIDASFKRIFPFSSPQALAPLDRWIVPLVHARCRIDPPYVFRFLSTLVGSALNTVLSLPERLLVHPLLRHRVPDPVFIVGVHRSGTTHLHNLLALDPNLVAPKNYQVFNPHGFLTTGWLLTMLFGPLLTLRRPIDAVKMHAFSAQEEEFAIAGLCAQNPYWGFVFPRNVAHYDRFIFPERMTPPERLNWKRAYLLFLRKLTCFARRRPVLKSPYNTARVAVLREMFSRAKFIHIYRHPHAVYVSNMHMCREGNVLFQLHDPDEGDSFQTRLLDNYRDQEDSFYAAAATLPQGAMAEVRFEDLERDPVGEVRRLYAQLGLDFNPAFAERLTRYVESVAGYKKNRFRPLPEDVRQKIDAAMGPYLARWGYASTGAETGRRAA